MARTKKTVNGGYQILDFNYVNITTEGIVVEGAYKTILDAIESNKPLMVKNVNLVDAGVDIEDNYANIVKVGTTFILSVGIVGDKSYTISITDANTTSYQVNDNASQSELNVVEDMVNQLSYNEAVPFDSTQTYSEGQYVIHEGQFYKCIIPVEKAGEFNINNWDTVTIGNELEEINRDLNGLIIKENNVYICDSIPADNNSKDFTFTISKEGYTPLGVIGISTNFGDGFSVTRYQIIGDTLYLTVVSRYPTVQNNVPFDITILYIKNI